MSVCSHCLPILVADDTNLFASGNDLPSISELLSKELAELSLWLKVNWLPLNLKQTQYMIFTRRKTISEKINIKIDHQNIYETKFSKFLGVYIDNSLNWKRRICYIAGKISRGIGIILKSRKYLNEESLLTLYYCFMYGEILIKQTCPNCKYFKTMFCESLLDLSPEAMLIPCIKISEFQMCLR